MRSSRAVTTVAAALLLAAVGLATGTSAARRPSAAVAGRRCGRTW
ncbi:hypothetical protein [Amycolatopsis sp. NPDC021455]